MFPNYFVLRRLADQARRAARWVAFNIEVDVDITEGELVEELLARGYGVHAR